MLAMFCFNLAIANYFLDNSEVAVVTFLGIGHSLLVIKAFLIIQNEKLTGLKEQAKQWLLEISLFIGLAGYSVGASDPLYCAILIVMCICGVFSFVGFALHTEMSKIHID